jgi:hypothetical protein
MAMPGRRYQRVVLPRRFPSRLLGRIVWYLVLSGLAMSALRLLFGEEPTRLPTGGVNPLAYLPHLTVAGLAAGLAPMLLGLFRRPMVASDSYALTLRPGSLRTLVLPWANVSDLGVYPVTFDEDPEPVLLVRCVEPHGLLGDTPGWWDQAVLRAATKSAGGPIGGYDVAVRLSDFVGDHRDHLAAIIGFAPGRVVVVDRMSSD